jgi:hypothetical protein
MRHIIYSQMPDMNRWKYTLPTRLPGAVDPPISGPLIRGGSFEVTSLVGDGL